MGMPFNADEVFEMAEQIEHNGAKFYRNAAAKLPEVRQIFNALADMEDQHEKTFANMQKKLSGTELEQQVFDPDDEAQMYLQVMADGHIFNVKADPNEKLAGLNTAQDVLKMALGLERDSIAFYVGIKESVSRKAGKDQIDKIIKEEIGHIAIIKQKMDELK